MERLERFAGEDVTALLQLWAEGDPCAVIRLIPLVYADLCRIAERCLAGERRPRAIEPRELVNEVCLRLLGWNRARWQNPRHFFGVSARLMDRVLVDVARRRHALRRGGPAAIRVPIEGLDIPAPEIDQATVAVDQALGQLAIENPRKARVVELRFFGGLSEEETAQRLGVSLRTVQSDWAFARAWLHRILTADLTAGASSDGKRPCESLARREPAT